MEWNSGGAWEFSQPYQERKIVNWNAVPGFVRVIRHEPQLQSHTKVVPFYTKNCEKSFFTTVWWRNFSGAIFRLLYQRYKKGFVFVLPLLMLFTFISQGFFILPMPVKLDTFFAEPVVFKEGEGEEEFALRIRESTQSLIDRVDALPEVEEKKENLPSYPTLLFLGSFTLLQNALMHTCSISLLLFTLYPLLMVFYYLNKFARQLFRPAQSSKKI
jgi:hypothetical protein